MGVPFSFFFSPFPCESSLPLCLLEREAYFCNGPKKTITITFAFLTCTQKVQGTEAVSETWAEDCQMALLVLAPKVAPLHQYKGSQMG
jgi:hypothetical protein